MASPCRLATPVAESIDVRTRGAQVEAAAQRHLVAAGLQPVAANANYRGGEIDLVMRDGAGLVFVEVRYRSHAGFGGAALSIDRRKQRRLVLAAQLFLASHRQFANVACRFDVVIAGGDPQSPTLTWMRDAFRADDAS